MPTPDPHPPTPVCRQTPRQPFPLLPRLTIKRLFRSFDLFRRYGTSRKISNFLRAELAFRRRDETVSSLPYLFRADPASSCTLGCPYCWRTVAGPMKTATLPLDVFIRSIDPFSTYCLLASFQMFGEPTLNDHLPDMVLYAHRRGIATYVSTNLQRSERDYLDRLLTSGLDLLTISLDAAGPETYRIMKPGGRYDRLMDNIHYLFDRKRSVRRPPAVGFQILVTRHNESELPSIRDFARSVNADYLDFKPVLFLPDKTWMPRDPKYRITRYEKSRTTCSMPWTHITLLANGRYFPCCAYPKNFDLGPLRGDPFQTVWNGPSLRAIRRGFRIGSVFSLCKDCPLAHVPRF